MSDASEQGKNSTPHVVSSTLKDMDDILPWYVGIKFYYWQIENC